MNPEIPNEPLSRRRMLAAGLGMAGGGLLAAAGCRAVPQSPPAPVSERKRSPFVINLADYAKGDGSDETEAIQRAINDLPPKDCVGFTGPGVTRHGRVIQLGTRHPQNSRILEPYVVDRRNTPGTEPPPKGIWQRGDGVINIEPDPAVPAKAWRGWLCVAGGEPGQWKPYGAIGA